MSNRNDPQSIGIDGRKVVVFGLAAIAATLGGLFLWFLQFRADYRELAAHGRAAVPPVVEPLRQLAPPDLDPEVWNAAVDATRGMLDRVVTAGVLDREDIDALRDDLAARVDDARRAPETARRVLAAIWVDMKAAAGPKAEARVLARAGGEDPAPEFLRDAVNLALAVPALPPAKEARVGIPVDDWRRLVRATRAMLLDVGLSDRMNRSQLVDAVNRARDMTADIPARPDLAPELLARVWDEFAPPDAPRPPELPPSRARSQPESRSRS